MGKKLLLKLCKSSDVSEAQNVSYLGFWESECGNRNLRMKRNGNLDSASIVDGEFFHETDEPFVQKLSLDPQIESTEQKTSPKRMSVPEEIRPERIDSAKM
uniref:Ovule protein n=1 Tax=Ascaris lumbricoides TaxID=6252 RepID=A0A0M3IJ95_ASCLU